MPRAVIVSSTLLGAIAVGCALYAWQLHGRLAETEAALAASVAREARARTQAMQHRAESDSRESAQTGSAAHATVAAPEAGETPFAPGDRDVPGPGRGPGPNSPEMRQFMAMQRQAALDGRYAALFRQLNLSPAQLEKLKALLAQKQATFGEVFAAAREQGLNLRENREQVQKLVQDLQTETDASIQSLLGSTGYQQYQQYEQTLPQRNVVGRLEQRLSYSSTPLYGNQAEQLVSVLAANSPAPANSTPNNASPFPAAQTRSPRITDTAIAQSQSFLSAPQVEALRQLQQEQAEQTKLLQQMQQARRNRTPPQK